MLSLAIVIYLSEMFYLQRREYLMNDGAVEDDFGDLDDY